MLLKASTYANATASDMVLLPHHSILGTTQYCTAFQFSQLIVRFHADAVASGAWVMGHGWEEAHWKGGLPSIDWIDAVSPHNPVLLYRMDVHMVLLNSVALRVAGITAATVAPDGGRKLSGKDGQPTGILVYVTHACVVIAEQAACCAGLHACPKPVWICNSFGVLAVQLCIVHSRHAALLELGPHDRVWFNVHTVLLMLCSSLSYICMFAAFLKHLSGCA